MESHTTLEYINPYRPKSMIWALMDEDFSDLTIKQIAEVFDTTPINIRNAIAKIKRETGYITPYNRLNSKQTL